MEELLERLDSHTLAERALLQFLAEMRVLNARPPDPPPPEATLDRILEFEWELERWALDRAIDCLPPVQRADVQLHHYDDFTIDELAIGLDLTPARVHKVLEKALFRLEGTFRLLRIPLSR
jgi:DNA-directed RNA polymerase specialized sigma24 family protein